MDWGDLITGVLGGASSLFGLISGNSAQNQAKAEAAAALRNMSAANSGQYNALLTNQSNNLEGMAGQGADAIANYSRGLGSDLANAGVYNSSGAAGAVANMARGEQSALSNAAAQDYYSANQLYNQQQAQQAQMALGQSNVAYNQASGQYNSSLAGFGKFLSGLGQSDLLNSGTPASADSAITAQMASLTPSQLYTDPGSAGGYFTDANAAVPGAPLGGRAAAPMMGAPMAAQPMTGSGPTTTAPSPGSFTGIPGYDLGSRATTGSFSPYSASGLGATTQANLARSGANVSRLGLPGMNGTVNQGANLGGNAGLIGNGGQGAAGAPRVPFSIFNSPYFYGR